MRKKFSLVIIIFYIMSGINGCFSTSNAEKKVADKTKQYEEACSTPFGRYPETITYTLGKMTGVNNSNMPAGDTYENNAYTRYLKEKLNVQNIDTFEATDNDYNNMITMAISSKNIPDVMLIDDYEYLKLLVKNDMIEDLTEVYKECASDRIKAIYSGYGDTVFNNITFNGKLMALPETNIEYGPNLLWLRKDWMDKLGLEPPKTLTDAENIIRQFIEKDPGENGSGKTIGLVCSPEITSKNGYSYMTQADIIFANFNSYPKQWIEDENGNAVYGSVQPAAKDALAHMNKLYNEGILDKQFLLRAQNNIEELIINGQCGSFFGLWWAPNNPLIESKRVNEKADWQPYLISTNADGSTSFCTQNPSSKYLVVRKGYKHPEIVMKINSVLFDYLRCTDESLKEIGDYYKENVEPTARPLGINVDYQDALIRGYENITNALNDKIEPYSLQLTEYSYYEQCKRYLENPDDASLEDWAAYTSRITSTSVLYNANLKRVKGVFFGETDTMTRIWWKLEELESEAYLKIITGEEPIDYFDKFSAEWYKQGGDKIVEEVNKEVKSYKEQKNVSN